MIDSVFNPGTPVQEVFAFPGIELLVKRDDLIHPFISGNKWRKLKYNIKHAREGNYEGILTAGGAYSNHLVAVASACSMFGLCSKAIVRGDELNAHSNYVLRLCDEFGMQLEFVSRQTYEQLKAHGHEPGYYFVPEGGANPEGILGCEEIFGNELIDLDVTDVVCAVGTATTLCGIIRSVSPHIRVHGIAALRNAGYLENTIREEVGNRDNWYLHTDYAGKGFGRADEKLYEIMKHFTRATGILLDPVYTAKVVAALPELNHSGLFQGKRVLMLHSGGLTGLLTEQWLKAGEAIP